VGYFPGRPAAVKKFHRIAGLSGKFVKNLLARTNGIQKLAHSDGVTDLAMEEHPEESQYEQESRKQACLPSND